MSEPLIIAIFTLVFTFLAAMGGVIYSNLNTKATANANKIDDVKATYATKEDFKEYKDDHTREHNKQDKAYEKLDKKIDQIIKMLMERSNDNEE